MTISESRSSLTWVHMDDLHITTESEPNYHDFQSIVSARIFGASPVREFRCRIDEDPWTPLHLYGLEWEGMCEAPPRQFTLTVEATDIAGTTDTDTIIVAAPGYRPPNRMVDGSDADALGAWPERHLLGTRLGPDRNGKQW